MLNRIAFLALLLVAGCAAPAQPGRGDPNYDPAEGGIPEGVTLTPFDTNYPAVGKLDPALRKALQQAATRARKSNVEMRVNSGWRTEAYQRRLLDDGVVKYGSLENASRYVATPENSKHVSGTAVDIGPTRAADWLIQHGSNYGLCQVYANELWHFELLTTPGGQCPPTRADALS
ncbi:M15 family metallopeptidase [Amycolatopsis jejuensis]|uniref:M15 family metallopeptidase n=1 Tax=Amycolatopsis jejuensis TaxID=330084 RepID=UPI000524E8FE|nr:M15 family metallopeptidase [Amycolatopsis jejuensis]